MPSSPKFFHSRLSSPSFASRRLLFLMLVCLFIGISGFIFGVTGPSGYRCSQSITDPRTVRVIWDTKSNANTRNDGSVLNSQNKRHKVMGFVGIQTGFASDGRRHSLRKTWMPSDRQGLQRYVNSYWVKFAYGFLVLSLDASTGILSRFHFSHWYVSVPQINKYKKISKKQGENSSSERI